MEMVSKELITDNEIEVMEHVRLGTIQKRMDNLLTKMKIFREISDEVLYNSDLFDETAYGKLYKSIYDDFNLIFGGPEND